MPYIKTLRQVYTDNKKNKQKEIKIENPTKTERSKFYSSQLWKKTRNNYIQEHPICELCYLRGIITPSQEIHHAIKFHQQYDDNMRWKLLTDTDNLISLCKDCHNHIHKKQILLDDNQKAFVRQKKDNLSWKYLQEGIIINYTNDKNT